MNNVNIRNILRIYKFTNFISECVWVFLYAIPPLFEACGVEDLVENLLTIY